MIAVAFALAAASGPAVESKVAYTVRPGDTLIALARRFMVTSGAWVRVSALNHIADPRHLRSNSILVIPRALLSVIPIGARIIAFRGPVLVDGRQVIAGAEVREGVTIATGTDASVTVECVDGSRFSLPSRTAVRVERLRRIVLTGDLDRVFSTLSGRSEWNVNKAPTGDSRFQVRTPVSVSAVRGTGFRVTYDGQATVGVVEGVVGVGTVEPNGFVTLPKGQGVAVARAGVGTPVALLAAPTLRIMPVQSAPLLDFAVDPIPGAKGYVFEVARDAAFVDRVREIRGTGPRAAVEGLPDASYHVRATATDANGIDGFSAVMPFERFTVTNLTPIIDGKTVRFAWTTGGQAHDYRFALFRDANGIAAIVERVGLVEPRFIVSNTPPGTYYWRVGATRTVNGRSLELLGPLQSVNVGGAR